MYFLIVFELTVLLNIAYSYLFLTRKKNVKYSLLIFLINNLIVLIAIVIFNNLFEDDVLNNYVLAVLGFSFIIYISFVFEESFSKKIFSMFSIWLFSNIILILCSYIVGLFDINDYNVYKIISNLFKDFVQVLFIPIIYIYFREPYKNMIKLISNSVINIISIYSVMIFLCIFIYYGKDSNKVISSYSFFYSLIFISIVILSYIIIFIAINSVNKRVELEYKFKIIDTQLNLQKQNYKTLNKAIENYYEFKHDIRHHVFALKAMLDAKNYVEASNYLDKFNNNKIFKEMDSVCENFTIDSILKFYMNIALGYSIDFNVNVNIPQDINIENLDLSVVIGNCIENSIEACNNIIDKNKKYIDVKAEIKGSHFILKIKNSFNGQIKKDEDSIITSKSDQGHGIGLSNVKKITEKYNGYFNIKYDDNEFEIDTILNITNER
ncbi:sensor histidine kinase [Clostridium sp. DL1XJH146]